MHTMEKDSGQIENYTVIDLEMTGLTPKQDKVIEIGAVKVRGGEVTDTYAVLVNPKRPISEKVVELTGITDAMAATGEDEDTAMQQLLAFIGTDILVGHNVSFDYSFLKQWAVNHRIPLELSACDTLHLARALLAPEQSKKLEALCAYFHIERANAHRALYDAMETQKIFECLKEMAAEQPQLLAPRVLTYKAKRQTPATEHQKQRLRELLAESHLEDTICWETLTRSEASRLQDKIRSGKLVISQ